ncbi:MAG: hypothetical protein ACRD3G_06785 [Vicinamibacterales bacterium]
MQSRADADRRVTRHGRSCLAAPADQVYGTRRTTAVSAAAP